eukprot:TRINITY_DN4336_c0_g1_i2.p1 TRINITY_DN4336_c0_g1~~TRINITY_DN4336_c0_g1_i2.p1  ORF type:complete len:136 (+),score=51.00 TRINITY_DN4336_c0_g1_i2:556-963(+)
MSDISFTHPIIKLLLEKMTSPSPSDLERQFPNYLPLLKRILPTSAQVNCLLEVQLFCLNPKFAVEEQSKMLVFLFQQFYLSNIVAKQAVKDWMESQPSAGEAKAKKAALQYLNPWLKERILGGEEEEEEEEDQEK